MNLNETPSGERIHIGIFGKRNAGKSSLINALTKQDIAIVSERKGTTTDPVYKAMELLPLGPVTIIDTPGLDDDDEGELSAARIAKAYQVLRKCHIALLVIDASIGLTAEDEKLWAELKSRSLPSLLVLNKMDMLSDMQQALAAVNAIKVAGDIKRCLLVSAQSNTNIINLLEAIAALEPNKKESKPLLVSDLLKPLDVVVLVTPIDESAPKGRIILPQQQVLRDILDAHASALVVQPQELALTLTKLADDPRLVITDSQVFAQVSRIVPPSVPLTSFSILMARYKGSLASAIEAAKTIDIIQDGDKVLISEGCTHHRQCQDIGTVKIPNWIREYTGVEPQFVYTSGTEFPEDLSEYKMIVHCGACMLNEKEMQYRAKTAKEQHVPMTNYGMLIAYMHGILKRTLAPIPEAKELLK